MLRSLSCYRLPFCINWNIRHLRIQTDEDGSTPRKTSIIDLELNRLNIVMATLVKPGSLAVDPFVKSTTPSSGADILKAKG